MATPELRMAFADRAALDRELESNLKHGRAFVSEADGIDALTDCLLRLVHPEDGAELALRAQAVMVCADGPMRGIGLQLRPFDAQIATQLAAFVAGEREAPKAETPAAADAIAEPRAAEAAPDAAEQNAETARAAEPLETEERDELADRGGDEAASDDDGEDEQFAAAGEDGDDLPDDLQKQPARHERLRKLSLTEQQKIARTGDLNDRVMLERIYGKHVWEGLLHNPKLTLPEVARIARKGTMPRPLLEFIVDNNAWIQAAIVRRALLGNPRVSGEAIMKLLRITPKHELRTIYKTNTYSSQVREAARKVLDL